MTAPNPVVVVRTVTAAGVEGGRNLWIWCPGCEEAHVPRTALPDGSQPAPGPYWSWNGRTDGGFGIEPSLLVRGADADGPTVCHSFIRGGRWQYLDDSTHLYAGLTVDMVPLPDWLVR